MYLRPAPCKTSIVSPFLFPSNPFSCWMCLRASTCVFTYVYAKKENLYVESTTMTLYTNSISCVEETDQLPLLLCNVVTSLPLPLPHMLAERQARCFLNTGSLRRVKMLAAQRALINLEAFHAFTKVLTAALLRTTFGDTYQRFFLKGSATRAGIVHARSKLSGNLRHHG